MVLILKDDGRSEFKKPFGQLYPSIKDLRDILEKDKRNSNLIISIGDVTTLNLQKEGIIPDMGIIDNRIERKNSEFEHTLNYDKIQLDAENPAGTLTEDLWNVIKEGFQCIKESKSNILIVVDGEEDLAVIPSVIEAPKGSVVIYGQPGEGVVFCEIDKVKNQAVNLLEQFEEA